MAEPDTPIVFDEERAKRYEERFAKIAPVKEALHIAVRTAFADLSPDARVLCVGAGTGAELVALANAFPGFRFVAVDPAAPMLRVARQRVDELGVADRCAFHEGTLDTLADEGPFDAATAILVSHFLTDPDDRGAFFRQIAQRLHVGGVLVSADLAAGPSSEALDPLFALWAHALRYCGLAEDEITEYRGNFGRRVAVLSAPETAALIEAAGFDAPLQVFQTLMMHGWCATRSAPREAGGR